MAVIKPTCIRDLKSRINLVDVVSRVATLRKAGSRFKGLCPFHQEKTPSFHVDPDKGFYKCFGCGKSGDIFTFVRDAEQLSFTEAVEALGQRFGIPIEYEEGSGPSKEERSLRQELFEIHELAADYFHQLFHAGNPTGTFMRAYWQEKRRFGMEIADEFRIGAAAPQDEGLSALLLKRKFGEEALRQCGLFFVREEAMLNLHTLKPRFRGRLVIPIRDHQGRVVAFTARQTELTPAEDPAREAKYVNSPETPIFSKGHLLFNLDRARTSVGDSKPFVMVEGQLDAIRCWSVGLKTAVAPQGTAITDAQLQLLRRYSQQIECFFDSDSAGQKAALRFLPMALKAGLEARFLTLTGEQKNDPDLLFLEKGLQAYEELGKNALPAMAFACRAYLPSPEKASAEQKARVAQTLFEIVSAAESEIARAAFIQELSDYLQLPLAALQQDFDALRRRQLRQGPPPAASSPPKMEPQAAAAIPKDSPEQHLLLLLLHHEKMGKILNQVLPFDWIDTSHVPGQLLHRFLNEIQEDNWPGKEHLDSLLETPEERALIASVLFDPPTFEDPAKIAAEGIKIMRTRALEPRLRKIELDLASLKADSSSNPISLLKERTELQRQLRQPIGLPSAV